jgi:hypothetical protein
MNSTINTPYLSQKTDAISFQADVCLKFFGFFGECVHTHCFDCSLVSAFTNETHLLLVRCDREIHRHLCGVVLKRSTKTKPFPQRTLREICGNSQETINFEAPSFTNFSVNTLNKMADHFALHRERLFSHL